MRGATLLLVAAACARAPAGTPGGPPSDARTADARPPIVDAGPATVAPDARNKGSIMAGDDTVLNAYFEAKGWGKPADIVPFDRVPGFYLAEFSDGGEYVVVRGGKIVTARGLAAAAAYIHDAKLVSHRPSVGDVIRLLILFDAMPPTKLPAPDQYYDATEHTELNPRLELDGAGKLTLCYLMPNSGHPVANPQIARVVRWTLALGGKPAWKSEELKFDMSK